MKKMWKNRGKSCGFCEEIGWKRMSLRVRRGTEEDGGGRTEEDGGRTEGGRSRTIIHTRSGGAGIVA